MSETKERTEKEAAAAEAIRQVIAQSGAVDFVDVVNAVRDRFRLSVTAAQVEQVYHELAAETKPTPRARTSVTLTSLAPEFERSEPDHADPVASTQSPSAKPAESLEDAMVLAVQFVKSVGGIANAKLILNELESALLGDQ